MPESSSACRVLVGDDEVEVCRLVGDVVRFSGYSADLVQDGRNLLRLYSSGCYDLIILDTLLVETSGLDVVMRVRNRGDAVPIILMYGARTVPDRVELFAFSYRVDLLRKPFGIADLRTAVARALREPGRD